MISSSPSICKQDFHLFSKAINFEVKEPTIKSESWVIIDGKDYQSQHLKLDFKTIGIIFRRKKKYFNKAVWITNKWSNNYFHWLTEISQKLALLNQAQLSNLPILLHFSYMEIGFVKDFFKTADIKLNIHILRGYEVIICKSLLSPSLNIPSGNYHTQLLNSFPFFKRTNKIFPTKRLFINRRNNVNRIVLNFEAIIPILRKYEIETVYAEDFTYIQQIELFRKADFILAVHGAGLTNMLWMQPKTNVLELRRMDDAHNNCFFSLAIVRNLNYHYLLCDVDNLSLQTQQNNFQLNKNFLEMKLKEIIK